MGVEERIASSSHTFMKLNLRVGTWRGLGGAAIALGGSANVWAGGEGATLGLMMVEPTAMLIILAGALLYFGFTWRTE